MNYMKKDDMLKDLKGLVSIESVSGQPEGPWPFGKGPHLALEYCLELCGKFGFRTARCGNYMGYAEIGEGERLMGILVHLDVVPAGPGWTAEPFDATIKGERIYGRGVIDDKGPAIAAIYAMKELLDSGRPLGKRVRIIFGCSEETGEWKDMEYYKETEQLPDFGFTPDADFPLIYAEKGILDLVLRMAKEQSDLISVDGGEAPNMVAGKCEAVYLNEDGTEQAVMREGKSAHGSMPWLGENAIGFVMKDLKGRFAAFYNETIGQTSDGSLLDCKLADEQSGEITINPGVIKCDDDFVYLALDIRYPISYTAEEVTERITNRVRPYGVEVQVAGGERSVFLDRESDFIKGLLAAYREVTGDDTEPMVMGGGTYARAMDNIVAFGPVFPGRECTEHQPDEYILIGDLYRAREIYRLAIERA